MIRRSEIRQLALYGLLFLIVVGIVTAIPTGPDSLIIGPSERRTTQPSFAVDALAGNVTLLTINSEVITRYWQGYYGNITGSIVLSNAENQTLYEWVVADPDGEIYASRNANIDWVSNIACANVTIRDAEETFLGVNVINDSDSVNRTFNRTDHPQFWVGSTDIAANTCRSTSVDGALGNGDIFYQVLLQANSTEDIIYTAIIDQNKPGFDGTLYDFQMLVGEPGAGAEAYPSGTTTTYYFYVEIQ